MALSVVLADGKGSLTGNCMLAQFFFFFFTFYLFVEHQEPDASVKDHAVLLMTGTLGQ